MSPSPSDSNSVSDQSDASSESSSGSEDSSSRKRVREEESKDDHLPPPQDDAVHKKKRTTRAGGRFLRMPNWDLVASSSSGTTTLSEYLPNMEVDTLLGWATHVSSPIVPGAAEPQVPNPLLDLPSSPLRSGELFLIHEAMVDFVLSAGKSSESRTNLLYRQFDQSALVSLGICLEEMMTASLLPLAQAHVRRCRTLEGSNDDDTSVDVLTEWTLPPGEAILKLRPPHVEEAIDIRLPTSRVPALAHYSLIKPSVFRSTPQVEARRAVETWRKAHGIEADYFAKNRETYDILVGSTSSAPPPPVPPLDSSSTPSTQSFEI